jgi:hypothetical protein
MQLTLPTGRVPRLVPAMIDQGIYSAATLTVSLAAARSLTLSGLGSVALAFVTAQLISGVVRVVWADAPIIERIAGAAGVNGLLRSLLGVSLFLEVLGLLSLSVPHLLSISIGLLIAPIIMSYEAIRPRTVAQGGVGRLILIDSVLLLSAFSVAIFAPLVHRTTSINWIVFPLGYAVIVGLCVASVFPLRAMIGPSLLLSSWRNRAQYVVDYLLASGSSQISLIAVGIFLSASTVGEVRLASIAFGSVNIFITGISGLSISRAVEASSHGSAALFRFTTKVAALVSAVAIVNGLALWYIPANISGRVLGTGWHGDHHLIAAACVGYVAAAVATVPALWLRARGEISRQVVGRLLTSPMQIFAPIVLGAWRGAPGYFEGQAVGWLSTTAVTSGLIRKGGNSDSRLR